VIKLYFINSITLFGRHWHNKRLRKTASIFAEYREVQAVHIVSEWLVTINMLPLLCSKQWLFLTDAWPLKMGPTDCPEISVINYHYSLRNNSEENSSNLLRGGSLNSHNFVWFYKCLRTMSFLSTVIIIIIIIIIIKACNKRRR
jgi:hypothetical protein